MYYQKSVDGFNWLLDINDNGIGRSLYYSNTNGFNFSYSREKVFMEILNKSIKKGYTCIDLGSNIGYATMFMARNSGDKGLVYAIEPDPHNLKILDQNIKVNNFNNIKTFECLITDHTGESNFWIAKSPNLNSVEKTKHSIKSKTIKSFTLKDFLQNKKYPNFIKMDIEGHEVKVLNSGIEYFQKNRGETSILLETHPRYYNEENDFKKTLMEYKKLGFKLKYIIGTPTKVLIPFDKKGYKPTLQIASDGWIRSLYENVVFEDGVNFVCNLYDSVQGNKCVRSIMLYREN